MAVINDISKLWQSLGSFWSTFEDKELIEVIWEAYKDVIGEKYRDAYQINLSKTFEYMPDYWTDYDQYYEVIYGAETATYSGLVNTVIISGLHNYYIESGIFSMPSGLYNWYYQDEDNERVQELLTEGTDFVIEDYDRLVFLNDPPFTKNANIPNFSYGNLYAPVVYSLNPVLFTLFGTMVGITKEQLKERTYHMFQTVLDDVEQTKLDLTHFKYLIWALHYLRRQSPTIYNLERLYGIAKGVPFSYTSGTVSLISGNTITIGDYSYDIPSGLTMIFGQGEDVNQFDLLVSGIDLKDWYNSPTRISELAEQFWQEKAIAEFTTDSSLDSLDHSETFVSGLMQSVVPKYLTTYYN